MNERIPEIGYTGAIKVFAPTERLIGPEVYNRSFFNGPLENLPGKGKIYRNLTPLGPAIMDTGDVLKMFSGKMMVLLVSDGEATEGLDPIKAAQSMYSQYVDLCIHVISLADKDKGKETLRAISKDCVYAEASDLLGDPAALDTFLSQTFYLEVPDEVAVVIPPPPPAPAPAVVVEEVRIPVVYFEFDKYTITPEWAAVLDVGAEQLGKRPDLGVVVEGHTDSTGPEEYNQRLSEWRAKAVYDYFLNKGIAADHANRRLR
jgi:OOP family OmpA-OmpF porin